MMQITTLRRVRLRPFAQGEIEGVKAQFIERIIDNDFSTPDTNFTKEEFLQRALIIGNGDVGTEIILKQSCPAISKM